MLPFLSTSAQPVQSSCFYTHFGIDGSVPETDHSFIFVYVGIWKHTHKLLLKWEGRGSLPHRFYHCWTSTSIYFAFVSKSKALKNKSTRCQKNRIKMTCWLLFLKRGKNLSPRQKCCSTQNIQINFRCEITGQPLIESQQVNIFWG